MATICLDQGTLRSPALASAVAEGGHAFLLHDAVFLEACKRRDWQKHLEPSMRLLTRCIDHVVAIRSHSDCLQLERAQSAALNLTQMVDPGATEVIRAMLGAFESGDAESWLEHMTPLVEQANAEVGSQYFNHEKNLAITREVHSHVLASCSTALRKALRRREDEDLLHRITTYATSCLLKQLAPRFEYSLARIDAEFDSPSYMTRSIWLRVFYAFDWIAFGGIEQVTGERNSNDEIDRHYIIVASYADRFITQDDKAERAERALRAALAGWELFSAKEAHWFQ